MTLTKTPFELFDDRYQELSFNNVDFTVDTEIQGIVAQLNGASENDNNYRKSSVITTIQRFIDILRGQNGHRISKSQSTLHDNRLQSLIIMDVIQSAKGGGSNPSTIGYIVDVESNDIANSTVLRTYLENFQNEIRNINGSGNLYLYIHSKIREFLTLAI